MMAARITRIQAFTALTQVRVMPLFFLPGALYPLRARPAWPTVLTRFDPITYVVCCVVWPMRHAVCSHLNIAPAAGAALFLSVTWGDRAVSAGISLGSAAVMGPCCCSWLSRVPADQVAARISGITHA